MPEKHNVYLAVPGADFCWGTVISVGNCTLRHPTHPYTSGNKFNCAIDFNNLWAHALNEYDAGVITHFAMLHGDITADLTQQWLDILIEELDERDATLVSVAIPIKDDRGLTSSGVCDPDNPWGAWKRFTQYEILHSLPKTFNAEMAGYPDRPLLHNTGCWACDLRKPEFHKTDEDGNLSVYFAFPERLFRGDDGKWTRKQESEDWFFSRKLWEAGARNTWITSRVRLIHHGAHNWNNVTDFGTYEDGDEQTAVNWRQDRDDKPLSIVQIIEFELGKECNLGHEHKDCPNTSPLRYEGLPTWRELDDDTIVDIARRAYRDLGFTGFIGWIYYNEPLMQADRMFGLMNRIQLAVPEAKFMLWTNGTLIPEDCESYKQFSTIIISGYNEDSVRGMQRLKDSGVSATWIENPTFDNRLVTDLVPRDKYVPCIRPFVEFIIDNYGNTHLCCYDWKGKATWGNVHSEPFEVLANRWRKDILPKIAGTSMAGDAPAACRNCTNRWSKHQMHDSAIIARANRWRDSITKVPV